MAFPRTVRRAGRASHDRNRVRLARQISDQPEHGLQGRTCYPVGFRGGTQNAPSGGEQRAELSVSTYPGPAVREAIAADTGELRGWYGTSEWPYHQPGSTAYRHRHTRESEERR